MFISLSGIYLELGWPYNTPFDQHNFSVHFRLFGLQSREWQLEFHVSRPQSSLHSYSISKTVRKRLIVTLAVRQVASSCWNQMSSMSPLQFLETKIRWALHGNACHWRKGGYLLIFKEKWTNDATVPKSAPMSHSLWVYRFLNNDVLIFWAPNATILLIYLLPKQSKMYWRTWMIEWVTVGSDMAVILMMLCFILKSMKPYFWKNIHKLFFIANSNSKC